MNRILWTLKQDTGPSARQFPQMAYDSSRGRTVLYGGLGSTTGFNLNDTWEWDGDNWTQVADTGPPGARYELAMAYDATGRAADQIRSHHQFGHRQGARS